MFSIFSNLGWEVPFTLLLMALMGLRAKVTPRTNLWINASLEKVWSLVNIYDGKVENWGRTIVRSDMVDAGNNIYRKTYTTTLMNGGQRPSAALFQISESHENKSIILERYGIENKPQKNELLKVTHHLTAENGGTRLKTAYHWGSRTLLAQLVARADLWSGAYRLKGLAENETPNERPYHIISAMIALITGIITLAAFALLLNTTLALLLVFSLFIHELGHLLAFRLIGQPWGRMIFLPFLGAVAVPRLPHESQGQAVFAALMGPGFSILLTLFCAAHLLTGNQLDPLLYALGMMTAAVNLFNLIPAEPLDGGIALRSVFARIIGKNAHFGLMAVGAIIVALGFYFGQFILVLFGGMAILANLKSRNIDEGLVPLTTLQLCITAFGYVAISAGHITLLRYFIEKVSHLPI